VAATAPVIAVIKRRRPLPGGRAVVGALLVAVAAVGTFAAASGATADSRKPYLVARGDLAPGHRLVRADLAVGRMDLPGYVHAFRPSEADGLVGSLVVGPVARGELLPRSALRSGTPGVAGGRQISFPIDPARAVGGELQAGEFVDVLATYGGAQDGYTLVVVRAARVLSARDRGGLAGADSLVLTLEVPTAEASMAVAHGLDAGHLTVVRSGPRGADEKQPSPYRAPAP
jgi:Flp pilus assembly protein CpaB